MRMTLGEEGAASGDVETMNGDWNYGWSTVVAMVLVKEASVGGT